MTRRVLLADDHPVVRRGLRALIDDAEDLRVTVEVGDGGQVIPQLEQVDVAVLDISLPTVNGLELLDQWPRGGPPAVMLTMHHEYVQTALERGARGYLVKEDAAAEIVACLRQVLAGGVFLSTRIRDEPELSLVSSLTDAERHVLSLLARHQTSREIAEQLGSTLRTVQNHRASAVAKLGLHGPGALLRFALAHQHELEGS